MKRTSKNNGTGNKSTGKNNDTENKSTGKDTTTGKRRRMSREDFPGYPHYPVKEDIMNTGREKLAIDLEKPEAPLVKPESGIVTPEDMLPEKGSPEDIQFRKGNSADVTKQEREELSDLYQPTTEADDLLEHRPEGIDMSGDDLVVPGAELDDDEEALGREDEENNLYSLGGDNHDRT